MSDLFGFVITRLGLNLLAKWGAGAERVISDIWVGGGRLEDGQGPEDMVEFTGLIQPIAQATSTTPQTVDNQVQFVIQYRNELNPGIPGFWLNEFGVFATDPDLGRILLLYGNLYNFPEWVAPFASGMLNVRNYPVSIGVSGNSPVVLSFPAHAFMTSEDMSIYVANAVNEHANKTVYSPYGVHGIRFYEGVLYVFNGIEWEPVVGQGGGTGANFGSAFFGAANFGA